MLCVLNKLIYYGVMVAFWSAQSDKSTIEVSCLKESFLALHYKIAQDIPHIMNLHFYANIKQIK